jgi:hypothetical protein
VAIFSSNFELDPARMNTLNLSDSIFSEVLHTTEWITDVLNALQDIRVRPTPADSQQVSFSTTVKVPFQVFRP